MIPKVEAGMLRLTVATAREFAADGSLAAGYTCLLQGLAQARRAVARGEPWGARLMLGYLQAADDYTDRYGVRIAATSETGERERRSPGT